MPKLPHGSGPRTSCITTPAIKEVLSRRLFSLSSPSAHLVPPHPGVNRLRPCVNSATQAADRLKAVSDKIGGGIKSILSLMVNDHNRVVVRPAGHQVPHDLLGEKHG